MKYAIIENYTNMMEDINPQLFLNELTLMLNKLDKPTKFNKTQ